MEDNQAIQPENTSAKHAERKEKAKNYSYNVKTLSNHNNQTFINDANTFLTTYFSNLSTSNFEVIKQAYFGRSMMTFTQTNGDEIKRSDFMGQESIISHLILMKELNVYNITNTIIQPGLGQGSVIVLIGTLNQFKMIMNLTIVKIQKQYYILNQIFNITS